ncbi:MAG TPA: aspartyl protease family protein [Phycisphaerae bacterium]
MTTQLQHRETEMGRFEVEVELANYDDIARARAGDIAPQQVRRTKISGVVDTGATKLVIPESTAKLLGVRTQGTAKVRYADGRSANRDLAPGVELTYFGRQGLFIAVIEPKRTTALIGAVGGTRSRSRSEAAYLAAARPRPDYLRD